MPADKMIIAAGFEDLAPLVIFFAIVAANIAKAVKKGRRSGNGSFADREPASSPAQGSQTPSPRDELQAFLERLSGREPARPPKPPPPVPQLKRRGPARQKAATPPPTPNPAKRRSDTPPQRTVPPPMPRMPGRKISGISDSSNMRTRNPALEKLRINLGSDLIDNASLRKAVVLREVLGPPLALKNQQSPAR